VKDLPDGMEFLIPSDFKYLGAVDAAVQDLAREFSCPQQCIDDFSTALIEACTNAIEHGNRFSKKKRVRVVIRLNGDSMITLVYDQGKGFEYERYLTEADPPDPFSERGRGIIIMKAFTDSVKYTYDPNAGMCVELVKSRKDGNPGGSGGDG